MCEREYKMTLKLLLFTIKLVAIWLLVVNTVKCYFPITKGDIQLETHESIDLKNLQSKKKPCDDFYEVKKGETYYSIVEKCKDPLVMLKNPHIQDPDDIYPGVILLLADIEKNTNDDQLNAEDFVNVENLNPHDISSGVIIKFRANINKKHCREFYLVEKGETFYSIAEKCNDPFILERNPHIEDPNDIFPGVILILQPHL